MGRLTEGYGGSFRAAHAHERARKMLAAATHEQLRQASRTANAKAYSRALRAASAKAYLGRMGAFGVPGRVPRLGPSFNPRGPGWHGLLASLVWNIWLSRQIGDVYDWARWPNGGPSDYDLTGWNVLCSSDPGNFPTEPVFKVGINPGALVGSTNVTQGTCGVSSLNRANAADGVTIPAGATLFQRVQSTQPLPNRNGRPFVIATFPGGSVDPVPFGPGKSAAPLPDAAPPAAEETEKSNGEPLQGGSPAVGAQPSIDFDFGSGGGSTVTPGWHFPVPPGRGEKEEKIKLGKGGAVGDLFGTVTEIGDAVSCLFKAAGGKGKAGLPEKTAFVAKNFDITDPSMVAAAIKCLALNHLEDMVIGKFGQAADKAFVKAQLSLGGKPARGVTIKRPPAPEGFQMINRMR